MVLLEFQFIPASSLRQTPVQAARFVIPDIPAGDGERRRKTEPDSYQELALLFPVGALSVGVSVGLGHRLDQLPLVPGGLRTVLEGFHHLLLLASLPVLLDKAPFSHPLGFVQHH